MSSNDGPFHLTDERPAVGVPILKIETVGSAETQHCSRMIGPIVAMVHGDNGPCFNAVGAHLKLLAD